MAVLFPLLLHFTGTWALPLLDRDEPRFAEATREMRAGGDWLVPHFNQHYRFDKPPLTYWAQTTCYKYLGENDFAARLPSVLATPPVRQAAAARQPSACQRMPARP